MDELEEQIRTMPTEELLNLHQLVSEELEIRQESLHTSMQRDND